MMLERFRARRRQPQTSPSAARDELRLEGLRGRTLVEESRENVVVLDEADRVLAASRRARESFAGIVEGEPAPAKLLERSPLTVAYEVDGRAERLMYIREPGDMAAYEELRAGFTASVSHELRTPLARLLSLLETALLPGADREDLIEQARLEVAQIGELIDDVLFISELESGREVVGLGSTRALPVVRETLAGLGEHAARAGVMLVADGDEHVELPLRPRMIRVLASNLAENAIRYAGPGATLRVVVEDHDGPTLVAADDGVGVHEDDLARLFERFYRADRARASRGTGLGLAIVKHVVASAGGTVEATGARGEGLTIRCTFPRP